MSVLAGRRPVEEALRAGRPIETVHVQQGVERRLGELLDGCRQIGATVHLTSRQALDRLAEGAVHQGIVAMTAGPAYADLEKVLEGLQAPGLLVFLDGVEDPHNLGAIVRTAHAAGADAVVIPERRAAGITPVVEKAAAGALAYLPVCRVTNIAQTLARLKEQNYWVVGLDENGEKTFREIDYRGGCIIVLGGEGTGLHRLVRERCDWIASIPMAGALGSLNVSVAAGVVLYEAQRQRGL